MLLIHRIIFNLTDADIDSSLQLLIILCTIRDISFPCGKGNDIQYKNKVIDFSFSKNKNKIYYKPLVLLYYQYAILQINIIKRLNKRQHELL